MRDIRQCVQCGNAFKPRREHARFCSADCRVAWNHANVGSPTTGSMALEWAMAAMADTAERLMHASGGDQPHGFAVITEAVWWVTMVDATLVRYHPDAYGRALASQNRAQRKVLENTFGGLRFVRNQMGYETECADFIQVRPAGASTPASQVSAWRWKPVATPVLPSLTARARHWELNRHADYQAQLAGQPIGDTFTRAISFLQSMSAASAPT
jgi:hypothetical protein